MFGAPYVHHLTDGWEWIFYLSAIFGLSFAVIFIIFGSDGPEPGVKSLWLPDWERREINSKPAERWAMLIDDNGNSGSPSRLFEIQKKGRLFARVGTDTADSLVIF